MRGVRRIYAKKDANTTPTSGAPPAQNNPPGMFPSPSSTLTVPSSQSQQPPTTPVSIFKPPAPRQQIASVPTNLFGGQITITPLKSKEVPPLSSVASVGATLLSNMLSEGGTMQRKDIAPSSTVASIGSMSFSNMLSGSVAAQTNSSPLVKQGEASTLPSSVLLGSGAANRSSGSGQVQTGNYPCTGFTTPPSSGSGQVQTSNYPMGSFTSPQNAQFGAQRTDTKPNMFPSALNTTVQQTPVKDSKNMEEKESEEIKNMLTKMIQMECAALEKEIKDLIIQGRHLKISLKPDEMDQIVQNTEDIKEFLKELVETCEIQSSEIHVLKQNTIQSWAWVEEAKSRFKESQDEELKILMKSKPLDSVSEKHLSTLKQMRYYLNSQMKQSHKALDDQWDKFQDYCRKNNRVQLPTMEAIFQTMVKQNAVLQKHNYILKDITSQIRGKQKASNHAALFNPLDKGDNLESTFQNMKLEPENIYHIYYQKVLNRIKSVPANKTNQLRRILHNREVPHVMGKSQLSTSALNSSLRTSQQANTTLKTPIGKKLEENSQLYQSTPLNLTPELGPQISSTPLSAFAPTSNLAVKPLVSTSFGIESQKSISASISNLNKENISTFKDPSVVLQSQNSLFKTPTMGTNEKSGHNAFTNFGLNQQANQNKFGTNRNPVAISPSPNPLTAPTNLQTLKFGASKPSVPTPPASKQFTPVNPSSNSNTVTSTSNPQNHKSSNAFGSSTNTSISSTQAGNPIKIFSFVSSAGQSKQFPDSTAVTSISTGVVGSSASFVVGGGMVPSNTFGSSSLFNSPSNTVSVFGKSSPGGSPGLFAANIKVGGDRVPNEDGGVAPTQSLLQGNSFQTTSGSIFSTSAANNEALAIGGVSKIIPPEAVATTSVSIFGTVSTGSVDNSSSSSKPLLTSVLTGSSVPTADTPILGIPSTSGSVPSTGKYIFGTSATSGGSILASSTSQFGTSISSVSSIQTKAPFGLSSSKGEPSNDNKSTFTPPVKNNEAVSSDSKLIFGTTATSTGGVSSSGKSIFGTAATIGGEVSSTTESVFGTTITNSGELISNSKSIFGTTAKNIGEVSSSSKSIFGTTITNTGEVSSDTKSIFGTTSTNTGEVPSNSKSIFGTTAPNTGAASPNSKSIFGTTAPNTGEVPSNSKSIFGTTATNTGEISSSSKSLFGTTVTGNGTEPTGKFSSVFGNSAGVTEKASILPGQVSITSKSIFDSVPTTSSSIFGKPTSGDSATNVNKSIFSTSVTSSASITKTPDTKIDTVQSSTKSTFNTSISNIGGMPTSVPSIFGATSTSTNAKSIFGASVTSSGTSSTTTSSVFGASPTAGGALSLTTKSIFENANVGSGSITKSTTPAASQSSPFGAPSFGAGNVTTTGSIFGNGASATSPFSGTTGKSVFGSATPASSPFGTSASVSATAFSATPFASSTSSNSVFGQTTSTGSQFNASSVATSPFSSAATNVQSPFASTPSTADSPFGAVAPPVCSPFGAQAFGTSFNTTTQSPFGQASTPSNIFGSSNPTPAPAFGTVSSTENLSSPFAQNSGGMFGSFGSLSAKPAEGSFGFANLNVGSASQSPFSKPNDGKSPFGASTFNPTTSTGSLFGSSTFGNNGNSVFQQTAFGGNSAFSSTQQSGPFSAGSGSIAQTGFGGQGPQKPPAFGSTPSFGGTPAFGSAPTFGGAPAFGSTSSFGSPNKVFGSASPTSAGSAFGSTNTQQSSGFGSFSGQNSLGFGSMTQTPNNSGVNPTQGSGFGNFASQNTIGFGNLAQQTNNSVQNAPFSGASSFSSWR